MIADWHRTVRVSNVERERERERQRKRERERERERQRERARKRERERERLGPPVERLERGFGFYAAALVLALRTARNLGPARLHERSSFFSVAYRSHLSYMNGPILGAPRLHERSPFFAHLGCIILSHVRLHERSPFCSVGPPHLHCPFCSPRLHERSPFLAHLACGLRLSCLRCMNGCARVPIFAHLSCTNDPYVWPTCRSCPTSAARTVPTSGPHFLLAMTAPMFALKSPSLAPPWLHDLLTSSNMALDRGHRRRQTNYSIERCEKKRMCVSQPLVAKPAHFGPTNPISTDPGELRTGP